MALTSTLESWADTSTGCPTLKRADRATAAGIRTARLLPHCWTVKIALLAMTTLRCINEFIHGRRNVNDAAWRFRQVETCQAEFLDLSQKAQSARLPARPNSQCSTAPGCTGPLPHSSRPESNGSCGHTRVMLTRYCPSSRSCGISSWIRIFCVQSHRRRKRLRTRKLDPTFSTRGYPAHVRRRRDWQYGRSLWARLLPNTCTFFRVQLYPYWDTFSTRSAPGSRYLHSTHRRIYRSAV